jgi:hypothetical protein
MNNFKKIWVLIIPVFLMGNVAFTQDLKFAERLMLNTSLTYIFNSEEDLGTGTRGFYQELVWKKSIAINLTKSIYFGFSHHNIYSFGSSYVRNSDYRESTYLLGTFVQYDFLPRYKERVYLEASWNYGNHCTCGINGDPFKKDDLTYLGIGGGVTFPITKRFSVDLAMIAYFIRSDELGKYAYNPYIINFVWDISNDKKGTGYEK